MCQRTWREEENSEHSRTPLLALRDLKSARVIFLLVRVSGLDSNHLRKSEEHRWKYSESPSVVGSAMMRRGSSNEIQKGIGCHKEFEIVFGGGHSSSIMNMKLGIGYPAKTHPR